MEHIEDAEIIVDLSGGKLTIQQLHKRNAELKQQRDDLLAVCNKALWYLCNDAALVLKEGDKIHDVLSKAIAKAQS